MKSGGTNPLSLHAAQTNFERIQVSDERFVAKVRAPLAEDERDTDWRPFDPARDPYLWWESSAHRAWWQKSGDRNALYWWRPNFWLLQVTPGWRFAGASPEGRGYQIDGLDVWKHTWVEMRGEVVIVKDPHYGKLFYFEVYQIQHSGRSVVLAAGEFSNSMWGFYVPEAFST